VVQVANGKIVEDWVSEDTMGMMRQLGVVPG
jgi:predicted ester cyclase